MARTSSAVIASPPFGTGGDAAVRSYLGLLRARRGGGVGGLGEPHLAVRGDDGGAGDLIGEVQRHLAVGGEVGEEGGEVAGVHLAGVVRQRAGEIERGD